MKMEVTTKSNMKIFMVITIIVSGNYAKKFFDLDGISEKLDTLTIENKETEKWPRELEEESWIRRNYEFGIGVGNREELLITNIKVWQDSNLSKNIKNWQVLELMDNMYLIGTIESTLLVYQFDIQISNVALCANISISGKIISFKIINLLNDGETDLENNVYLILSVEVNNKVYNLKWFQWLKHTFVEFWIWGLEKPVKSLEYFYCNDHHKLVLLYADRIFFHEVSSLFEIYQIKINSIYSQYRLCHSFLLPQISTFQICSLQEDKLMISVLNQDHIIMYEYKDEDIGICICKQVQSITIKGLKNAKCFESGNVHYLATSGPTLNLFEFLINKYAHSKIKDEFYEIRNVDFIQNLPVKTYRQALLLIQLKNSSLLALSWYGLEFKIIYLSNKELDNFDLSKVAIIPNFGFLIGNSFIKFKFQLNQLSRYEENETKEMLEMKFMFKDILDKQEFITMEMNSVLNQSYLTNSKKKEEFNSTQKVQSDNENIIKIMRKLESKIDKIENNLNRIHIKNATDIILQDIDITGDLEIKGTLTVDNLTIGHLNGISMDAFMNECLRSDNMKIIGVKSFPSIKFTENNLKIKNLNGIPLKSINFNEGNKNQIDIDLSKITKLKIKGDLNVSRVCGIDWEDLLQKLVFKNEKRIIHGDMEILGQMTAHFIHMDYLNEVKYPSDYVQKSGPEDAHMTDVKYFEILRVSDLLDLKTINEIDIEEFIILNEDQTLEHLITFENLVIDESLQIDGNIIGLSKQDIDPDLTLLNSNVVQSNVMFTNLKVTGKIYVENSMNGTKWLELDDLILNDEKNVVVTGLKTFLGNIHIVDNLEIKSGIINGHSVRDFITLNTEQILPNLEKISGNVRFIEVSYKELKTLEEKINRNINNTGNSTCMEKPFIFIESPIIDEFIFSYINKNITGSEFFEKFESLLKHVSFEHLNAKKLVVNDLVTTTVNNINIQEFKNQIITKNDYQNISGSITVKYLEIEKLCADIVNNRSAKDLENTVKKINVFYDHIFNGDILVNSLNVTKSIRTSKINLLDLNDLVDINNIQEFIFRTNKSIENVVVEGLVNDFNLTKKVYDSVLRTENNVIITGPKKIKKLKSQNLQVQYINGHSINDIVSVDNNQILTGPVKIKGSVNIQQNFISNGRINEIIFKNISEIIQKLDNKVYRLTGDFEVYDDAEIKDLNVFGAIQERDINEFLKNLIFLSEKETVITGAKIFNSTINFLNNITIMNGLNEIDLKTFYQTAVLIDRPISVNSKVIFENDILLESDLFVTDNLKVSTISGISIEDLIENAIYLNRPTSFMEAVTFSNIIFQSDIKVDSWNDVKLNTLFTLNNDEVIRENIMGVDILADNLEILGFINGENLTKIYENTFMLSTDQNITGKISFLNNVYVGNDFNSRYINNVDITKTISLHDTDPLIGDFVFDSSIIINNSLQILGNLNGVDFSKWKSSVITTTSLSKQRIFGKWTLHGNVYIQQKFRSPGSINGINIQKHINYIKKQRNDLEISVSNKMREMKKVCEDLQKLKIIAENMLHKFKSFEYFKVLQFDLKIISINHFEMKNKDYMMVNFETCHLDIFVNTNEGFILAANFSNFGYIKQYITLNYDDIIYFVTIGRSECGRNSGNLWSFENLKINHIFDLGNAIDVDKLGNDRFVIIVDHQIQEWSLEKISKNSLKPVKLIPIKEKNVHFLLNAKNILLIGRNTIYSLQSDALEFEELENPFNTNEIMSFQAGIFSKEFILSYDDRISSNYVYIYNSNLSQRKIVQTINTHKPSSFLILNFDKFQENLLIFSENKRKIQIYEYKGIEGFKYHSNINLKIDKLYNFNLRIHPHFSKSRCLAVIQDKTLKILEAKMYGERLDMNNELICDTI